MSINVNAYWYGDRVFLISIVSIARKCIGAVPILRCKFMYLPRFGDSILHTLQFAIAWQMSFFMPFQKNIPRILLYDL